MIQGVSTTKSKSIKPRLVARQTPDNKAFHPATSTKTLRAEEYAKAFSALKIHEPNDKNPVVENLIRKVIAFYTSQRYSKWRISAKEVNWLVKNIRARLSNPEKVFSRISFNELLDWYKNLLCNKTKHEELFIDKLREWEGDPIRQKFALGNFNEFRTEIALRHLMIQGFISRYFRSPNASAYDYIGIDFLIEFEHENKKYLLPIQVKSSQKAVKEYLGSHRNINALCATNMSISEILKTLKAIINFNLKRAAPIPKVLSEDIKNLKPGERIRLMHNPYRQHPISEFDIKDQIRREPQIF